MAKRFIDTKIWDKAWFRKLTPKNKLIWIYLLTRCDHAGIWDADWEAAEFYIGEWVDYSELPKMITDKMDYIEGDDQYFIPSFVDFQYGQLRENSKPHLSVIKRLSSKGLYNPLNKSSLTLKDKDKEKAKDKVIDKKPKNNESRPKDLKEVIDFFTLKKIPNSKTNAEKFYNHYESANWFRGKTKIKKWRMCLSSWDFKEESKNNFKSSFESGFSKTPTGLYKAYCSKCGNREMPNDKWQLKEGSNCCRVDYVPQIVNA
tara:strand:- start:1861 stop:2637 length:777 start_codon:yes stop_codon:yes gene_type:complete